MRVGATSGGSSSQGNWRLCISLWMELDSRKFVVWIGVPNVTWPMYAKQQLSAFMMVKEMGLAVGVEIGFQEQRQSRDGKGNRAKALHCVMDGCSLVRVNVKETSDIAKKAIKDGGS
ncbi:hypothetical protein SLEP1_g27800 [Rubroshorea leprosula]|nr:hypothetical protein SLEP1_g27800 [Rubroshorea leprosula]